VKTVSTNGGPRVGEGVSVPVTPSQGIPTWPKTALRIGFGVIWLIDAVLKWLPDFHKGLLGMVKAAAAGQPGWLHGWFHLWISTVQAHTDFWAYGVAVLETVIALALIFGFARKLTYMVTIFSGVMIWGIAEGFGGPYSGTSTDIGTAIIYAVVALALLVLSQYPSSRFSVDYLLEQRVSWWHRVAEFGKHNHPTPEEKVPAPLVSPAPLAPPVGPTATAH
jgi:nitrite reductase (NO-forming)